jgi:hypothetical protein
LPFSSALIHAVVTKLLIRNDANAVAKPLLAIGA